jgi:hypothetical protein
MGHKLLGSGLRHVILNIAERRISKNSFTTIQLRDFSLLRRSKWHVCVSPEDEVPLRFAHDPDVFDGVG